MNARTATKAAMTLGWFFAAAVYFGTGSMAQPVEGSKSATHPKVGKEDCATCHSDVASKPHVHAATADCTQCHEYTESQDAAEGKIRLVAEGSDLCFVCHTDIQDRVKKSKTPHQAAADDCKTCHDPHSSTNEKLLKEKQQDLCTVCHADMGEKIAAAKYVHAAVTDRGCAACHDPHGADVAPMLKTDVNTLCMSCHRWEDRANPKNPTKRRILDSPDGLGHPLVGHPFKGVPDPSAKGAPLTCLSCHDPHVGPMEQRLKFQQGKNDFCSRCH
jgi:predicted CXXCH cytochrome family protein